MLNSGHRGTDGLDTVLSPVDSLTLLHERYPRPFYLSGIPRDLRFFAGGLNLLAKVDYESYWWIQPTAHALAPKRCGIDAAGCVVNGYHVVSIASINSCGGTDLRLRQTGSGVNIDPLTRFRRTALSH